MFWLDIKSSSNYFPKQYKLTGCYKAEDNLTLYAPCIILQYVHKPEDVRLLHGTN